MVSYAFHFHLYNFDVWMVSSNLKCLWELCLVTGTAEFQAYTWRKLRFGHTDFLDNSSVWLQVRRQIGGSSDGCTLATSLERSRLLFPVLDLLKHSAMLMVLFCGPPEGWGQHSRKYFVMIGSFLWDLHAEPLALSRFRQCCSLTLPLHNSSNCPMMSALISLCPLGTSWTQVSAW